MKFNKYDLMLLIINLITLAGQFNILCITSFTKKVIVNNTNINLAENIIINTTKTNITNLITDKVDLDIKKLDIKLEKLTKMIETFEMLGNVTTKDTPNRIKTIKIKTFNSQNLTKNEDVTKETINNVKYFNIRQTLLNPLVPMF
jgi:hypothetical protein